MLDEKQQLEKAVEERQGELDELKQQLIDEQPMVGATSSPAMRVFFFNPSRVSSG